MKNFFFILILLFPLVASALQGSPQRYPPGSVFNLKTYLPWENDGPEIIRYPIGCSVNTLADFALQTLFPKSEGGFSKIFHASCARHDLCYRHGYYTYQFTKDDCDDEFAAGLEDRCQEIFQGGERRQCQRTAAVLILAARKFGHLSYHSDDYSFRDYGYYYEYLDNRPGQYSLFWLLLTSESDRYRNVYREKVNENLPLPSRAQTRRLLLDFFTKKIGLKQLITELKGAKP